MSAGTSAGLYPGWWVCLHSVLDQHLFQEMGSPFALTVGSTFGCRSLAPSTTNTHAIDDITLLGLVA